MCSILRSIDQSIKHSSKVKNEEKAQAHNQFMFIVFNINHYKYHEVFIPLKFHNSRVWAKWAAKKRI